MAEPKKKLSKTRTSQRRSGYRVNLAATTKCAHCQQPIRPHAICPHCGYYKGKKIIGERPTERIVLEGDAQ